MKKIMVLALLALLCSGPAAAGDFMAGAASADITPDLSTMKVPSAGYGARGRTPMKGAHDPVHCKALVVDDGVNKAAIVTCDLIGISPLLRRKVLDQLHDIGINDNNLMMTASHTHSGPGAMNKNFIAGLVFGRYNEKLTQMTADRVAQAVRQADASRRPAALLAARGDLPDATRNRRDPAGSYNYDTRRFSDAYDPQNPANDTDPEVTVIRIDSTDGRTIAVLVGFASHATVMGSDNLQITADWPGAMQSKIETAMPGAVALFVNGAIGDQAPAMENNSKTDWEYVDYIGGLVADKALELAVQAEPVEATPVRAEMVRRKMPPGKTIMGLRGVTPLIKYYFPEMPLMAVRMGYVVVMGAPVEMVSEIGRALKAGALGQGPKYAVVAGLANDTMLYCATPEDFPAGGYEVGNTIFGEVEAGIIIGEQMLLVRKLYRE